MVQVVVSPEHMQTLKMVGMVVICRHLCKQIRCRHSCTFKRGCVSLYA